MAHPNILKHGKTAVLIVDVQEAFRSAIGDFALVASRISMAARGFAILDVPILVTEQYPQGLGRTAEEIVLALPDDFEAIEKSDFSSCGASAFTDKLTELGTEQVVICGLETHICVSQTAHDLIDRGLEVHVLTECVCSRFEHDRRAGVAKMKQAGVVMSSMEIAFFELMGTSKHPKFKEIQSLIR